MRSVAKPSKIALYLAGGDRLRDAVNAYRAARGAASAEEPVTQSPAPAVVCNKRKSYPLPPLPGPTEIPGFPLNLSPPAEAPDYGNLARVQAIRAAQAARRGKRAAMTPRGPSRLVKRGSQ